MNSYNLLLFLHVLAVIVAFGVTFAWPFLQAAAERQGTGATKFALNLIKRVDRMITIPGAVLIALFGIGLIFDDALNYNEDMPAWLELSITLFVITFVVGVAVQHRTVLQAIRVLEPVPDDAPLPETYTPLGKRMQMVGGMLGLAIIVITFLMTWQPALWD